LAAKLTVSVVTTEKADADCLSDAPLRDAGTNRFDTPCHSCPGILGKLSDDVRDDVRDAADRLGNAVGSALYDCTIWTAASVPILPHNAMLDAIPQKTHTIAAYLFFLTSSHISALFSSIPNRCLTILSILGSSDWRETLTL
jgi:hypothetical protein